jgi:hypothetical protein
MAIARQPTENPSAALRSRRDRGIAGFSARARGVMCRAAADLCVLRTTDRRNESRMGQASYLGSYGICDVRASRAGHALSRGAADGLILVVDVLPTSMRDSSESIFKLFIERSIPGTIGCLRMASERLNVRAHRSAVWTVRDFAPWTFSIGARLALVKGKRVPYASRRNGHECSMVVPSPQGRASRRSAQGVRMRGNIGRATPDSRKCVMCGRPWRGRLDMHGPSDR